jgi:uncharacterized protein (TIGR02594 family)
VITLRLGSRGTDVRRLQLLLNSLLGPSPRLRPDGHFGQRTHAAVLAFQAAKRLAADGAVDPRTWAALGQRPAPAPPAAPMVDAPWMEVAAAELGVQENSLPGHHTQRILEYHAATTLRATTDEVPWCSSFVNWVMRQAGHAGTGSALARSWLAWGRAIEPPRPGAITVIKRKGATSDAATGSSTGFHVGFFVGQTPATLRLLGGNQGNRVRYSNFLLAAYEVRGHRWP